VAKILFNQTKREDYALGNFMRGIGAASILFALCIPGWGQQRNTAGIYGLVTDPQGSSVIGAKITLTQVETGIQRISASNAAGEWEFPSIAVGSYSLTVEKNGFSRVEQKDIVLQVNDNRRVDVSLTVGAVSTTVTVEAAAATVNTSDATLKDTVDSQRVEALPLNGRDLADLAFLVPGVQSASGVAGGSGDGAKIPFASRRFSINGSRQNTLAYTLDGGDNQDTLQNTGLPIPFPDAIMEFSVETSLAGVGFGKSLGGSLNIVTKSGTNAYHGDAFWFVRNTDFDANNFFSHVPDNLKQNQTGFTAGGPIIKDKLFVFGGYQQTWVRALNGSGTAASVPAARRPGNLSDLLTASKPVTVLDPITNTPFPGNIIPTNRLSPAAQNLLAFAPAPGPNGLVFYSIPVQQNAYEWITRADYRLNSRNSFYLRLYDNHTETPAQMNANNIFSSTQGIVATSQTGSVGWVYTPSSDMVVETHFTGNQYDGDRTYAFPGSMKTLGVNVNPSSNAIGVSLNGTSNISMSSGTPAVFARANIELAHSWQWVKGRHSIVWGADLEDSRYNEYNTFNGQGVFGFNGEWSGYDQADFLLGQFSSFTQGNGEIEFKRLHYFGFYAGDTFRLTPRLSLSFGLRWEPYLPITDLNNRIDEFNQAAYQAGSISQVYVNAPPGMLFPGDKTPSGSSVPAGVIASQLAHFAPRFGFAYDLLGDGKTSVRGGYGIYYDTPEMFAYNNMNDQAPFSFTVNFLSGSFDNPYAGRQQLNVFPYSGDFQKNSAFPTPFSAVALQPTQLTAGKGLGCGT
jgi:Carboxypeptidase regulatory-like domain